MKNAEVVNGFFPDVAMYLEGDGKNCIGTLVRQSTGAKVVLNGDACELALSIVRGESVGQLVSNRSTRRRRQALRECNIVHDQLTASGFIGDEPYAGTKIRTISVKPPLRVIILETTKRCNLRCGHCYVEDSGRPTKRELDETELLDIIGQADAMGVMEVQLTGGEVLVLPFAHKLVGSLQERLVDCSVFTNGMVLPAGMRKLLKRNSRGLIFYVSLDGLEKQHDWLRRQQGAFVATNHFIEELLALGCDVRINTAVGRHNIDTVRSLQDFVTGRFGVMHRFVMLENVGRVAHANDLLISSQEFAGIWGDTTGTMQFLDSHDALSALDWRSPACGVAESMMFINAYGDASLCPTMTQMQSEHFAAGNIRSAPLSVLWENSPVYRKFRGIQCNKIRGCPAQKLCRGGCRSKAFLDAGDVTAPDREMCQLYKRTAR